MPVKQITVYFTDDDYSIYEKDTRRYNAVAREALKTEINRDKKEMEDMKE